MLCSAADVLAADGAVAAAGVDGLHSAADVIAPDNAVAAVVVDVLLYRADAVNADDAVTVVGVDVTRHARPCLSRHEGIASVGMCVLFHSTLGYPLLRQYRSDKQIGNEKDCQTAEHHSGPGQRLFQLAPLQQAHDPFGQASIHDSHS